MCRSVASTVVEAIADTGPPPDQKNRYSAIFFPTKTTNASHTAMRNTYLCTTTPLNFYLQKM